METTTLSRRAAMAQATDLLAAINPTDEELADLAGGLTRRHLVALSASFPDSMVREKEGKSYVGHAHVTDRLLQVDPNWNWEPDRNPQTGRPDIDWNQQGRGVLWAKITICGKTMVCVGIVEAGTRKLMDGNKPRLDENGFQAYQYFRKPEAEKELISDLIRNGAMRFGVALYLWAKGGVNEMGDYGSDPTISWWEAAGWTEEGAHNEARQAIISKLKGLAPLLREERQVLTDRAVLGQDGFVSNPLTAAASVASESLIADIGQARLEASQARQTEAGRGRARGARKTPPAEERGGQDQVEAKLRLVTHALEALPLADFETANARLEAAQLLPLNGLTTMPEADAAWEQIQDLMVGDQARQQLLDAQLARVAKTAPDA